MVNTQNTRVSEIILALVHRGKRGQRNGGGGETRRAATWGRMRRGSRGLHTSLSFSLFTFLSASLCLARSFFLCVSINRAGIRQLSSIEAAQAPQGGPPPPPPELSRPRAGDLAVKSRLRAAHDTLNPRLVDPETFNLDVTACCQEEISLYSRDTPSPLPRGRRSGADHSRTRSRLKKSCPLRLGLLKNLERRRVNKMQSAKPVRVKLCSVYYLPYKMDEIIYFNYIFIYFKKIYLLVFPTCQEFIRINV